MLFPLLIARWTRTWHWKLAGAIALLLGIMFACQIFNVPKLDLTRQELSNFALLYISPLGRLLEFILGMCAALLWHRMRATIAATGLAWTIAELLAVGLAFWAIRYGTVSLVGFIGTGPLPVAQVWAVHAGSCWALAILVFAMASGQGLIGRIFSTPIGVFLGEFSYAMYLIHVTLITAIAPYFPASGGLSKWEAYAGFLVLLLLGSVAMHFLVERPARAAIRTIAK